MSLNDNSLVLKVSVPITCLKVPTAREYIETLHVPPPSTVYGMLLSIVGETNRRTYIGTELAIAMISDKPELSQVLRTFWRVKSKPSPKEPNVVLIGLGDNRRPDFQELLTNLNFIVAVRATYENNSRLIQLINTALNNPKLISRFGGLSFGESRDLVNDVTILKNDKSQTCEWLVKDIKGSLPLPIWADHVGSRNTNWLNFTLQQGKVSEIPEESWIKIKPKD